MRQVLLIVVFLSAFGLVAAAYTVALARDLGVAAVDDHHLVAVVDVRFDVIGQRRGFGKPCEHVERGEAVHRFPNHVVAPVELEGQRDVPPVQWALGVVGIGSPIGQRRCAIRGLRAGVIIRIA